MFLDASIIIPSIKAERLTLKCVEECRRLFPTAEIIVVLDEGDLGVDCGENVKSYQTGPITIAAKRNFGCKLSTRSVLAFIDSDAYPCDNWLVNAIELLNANHEMSAIAGPNLSPEEESFSEKIVGLASRSRFCVLNAHYVKNKASRRIVEVMPSCNLIIRKDDFTALGGMDETLYGAEDFEFCNRMRQSKKKMLYDPEVAVRHKNRNLTNFFKKKMAYGGFAIDSLGVYWSAELLLALFPFFMLLFVLSGLLILFLPIYAYPYFCIIGLYLGVLLFESIRFSKGIIEFLYVYFVLAFGVIMPGVGSLARLFGILGNYRWIYRNFN